MLGRKVSNRGGHKQQKVRQRTEKIKRRNETIDYRSTDGGWREKREKERTERPSVTVTVCK
jgi:hypothetical protein